MSFIHKCISEKTVTRRPNDKPWMDSLLRKTIRIRNRFRKKAQKSGRESDWFTFRKYRNEVNNMKNHAIADYYRRDANKNNQKLYWKLLKDKRYLCNTDKQTKGSNCISHKMLKSCIETISKPLCLLFNKSLSLRTLNSRLLEISTNYSRKMIICHIKLQTSFTVELY